MNNINCIYSWSRLKMHQNVILHKILGLVHWQSTFQMHAQQHWEYYAYNSKMSSSTYNSPLRRNITYQVWLGGQRVVKRRRKILRLCVHGRAPLYMLARVSRTGIKRKGVWAANSSEMSAFQERKGDFWAVTFRAVLLSIRIRLWGGVGLAVKTL